MADGHPHVRPLPKRLLLPLWLTHLGLFAERATRAFWPLWSVLFVGAAAWGLGLIADAAPLVRTGLFGVFAVLVLGSLWFARRFRLPSKDDALARLDAALPGRPIQTLLDTQTIGTSDPASQAVWEAHKARMTARLAEAKAAKPDLRVSKADPFALRYTALLVFALAFLFGTSWRGEDLALSLGVDSASAVQTGQNWEVWIEPPRYTGKPSLYLSDIPEGTLEVPTGSQAIVRFYGEVGGAKLAEAVSGREAYAPEDPTQAFEIVQPGSFSITDRGMTQTWELTLLPDALPQVEQSELPSFSPPTNMRLPFFAYDDYGVISGTARFALDLEAVDRRFGLSVDPETRDAIEVALPLPIVGSRSDFSEVLEEDFSKHPFANLPVEITLSVTDAAQQIGTSAPVTARLPGRRFFDPIASALIEARRDLLWSRANAPRVAQVLRAVSYEAEGFYSSEEAFAATRQVIDDLEATDALDLEQRDALAELLWEAALKEEEGNLESALERLRQAQERLREAIRRGASQEEIDQLMREMQEAMDNYLQQKAQENERSGADEPQGEQGESQDITGDQLNELMERIEELMEEGRTAEAMQLLEELQELLENLQVEQGQGQGQSQQGPGEQAMENLRDTLRDQQELSDEAFQELQDQFNPGRQQQGQEPEGQQQGQQQGEQPGQQPGQQQGQQPGQQQGQQPGQQQGQQPGQDGEQGQGGTEPRDLAGRQGGIRGQLQQLRDSLPGAGSEQGEAAREALDQAGRAMEEAEGALENNQLADALDDQARAMDALREGLDALAQALNEQQQQGQDQAGERESQGGNAPGQSRDPLGRRAGTQGQLGTQDNLLAEDDLRRRARDLFDEIRRRSGEQEREQVERDYLNRLLQRF